MAKLFSIRKPKFRITGKGVKFTAPSARIGGRMGVNVSKSGISGSVRGRKMSYNTKRGLSLNCFGVLCLLALGSSAVVGSLIHVIVHL